MLNIPIKGDASNNSPFLFPSNVIEHHEKTFSYHNRPPNTKNSTITESSMAFLNPLASVEVFEALGMSSEPDRKNSEGNGLIIFDKDSQ